MAAYAAAALILAWIPVLGAFPFTYALIVLMGIGIHSVYWNLFLDHCRHSRGWLRARRVGSDLAHNHRGGFLERSWYSEEGLLHPSP